MVPPKEKTSFSGRKRDRKEKRLEKKRNRKLFHSKTDEKIEAEKSIIVAEKPPKKRVKAKVVSELRNFDDDEIEWLERKLNVKKGEPLPKEFVEDGLDELLEGLDDISKYVAKVKSSRGQVMKADMPVKESVKLASLAEAKMDKLREKLEGGQFRRLNEFMYGKTGTEALETFQEEPDLFEVYHRGFSAQVKRWPVHPLDSLISWIRKRNDKWTVADIGCGEAFLAAEIPQKTYSFDLQAMNDRVTIAEYTSLPIPDESVDVAVFCLSLMGTDYSRAICEAHRILRPGGWMLIAEIAARFASVEDKDKFIVCISSLGFAIHEEDMETDMFIHLRFQKITHAGHPVPDKEWPALLATVYKKR